MAARRVVVSESLTDGGTRVFGYVEKAYWFWAIGVVIGAVGLKGGTLSAAGFGLTLEHPDVVQGILYLAALVQVAQVYMNVFQENLNPFVRRPALREFMWQALPRGTRSFRNMSIQELKAVREKVRKSIKAMSGVPVAFVTVPGLLIIVSSPLLLLKTIWALVTGL